MSDQQELRQRREALAQAVNRHDREAVLSFVHPSYVGKTKHGWRIAGYQHVVRMLENVCAPGSDYHETVSIEEIEVSGDSASLVVRRVARAGSRSQEDRAQETWRLIDGRWLLVEERQQSSSLTPRQILVAVVVVLAVGAYVALSVFTGPGERGTEFQRAGVPALKLEVRRASTKEVDGWKVSTTPDDPEGKMPFHVSADVELTNADVLSTRAYFQPGNQKAVSRWKGGVTFLVLSVVLFVVCWNHKEYRWWWSGSAVICLLLGIGGLWHGLTSTAERFEQQGIWQVVIRFDDAGTKKLADLTASMMDGRNKQTKSYPSKHVAFLIDGELSFAAPVWEQNTEGIYYLTLPVWEKNPDGDYYLARVGLSEEAATRIAKGIAGP